MSSFDRIVSHDPTVREAATLGSSGGMQFHMMPQEARRAASAGLPMPNRITRQGAVVDAFMRRPRSSAGPTSSALPAWAPLSTGAPCATCGPQTPGPLPFASPSPFAPSPLPLSSALSSPSIWAPVFSPATYLFDNQDPNDVLPALAEQEGWIPLSWGVIPGHAPSLGYIYMIRDTGSATLTGLAPRDVLFVVIESRDGPAFIRSDVDPDLYFAGHLVHHRIEGQRVNAYTLSSRAPGPLDPATLPGAGGARGTGGTGTTGGLQPPRGGGPVQPVAEVLTGAWSHQMTLRSLNPSSDRFDPDIRFSARVNAEAEDLDTRTLWLYYTTAAELEFDNLYGVIGSVSISSQGRGDDSFSLHPCEAVYSQLYHSYRGLLTGTTDADIPMPLDYPQLPRGRAVPASAALRSFITSVATGERELYCSEACAALAEIRPDSISWEDGCWLQS